MALDLTPEQKATGKANFEQAAGDLARAGKMNTMVVGGSRTRRSPTAATSSRPALAAGAVVPVSAAVYFGYQSWKGNKAVKTALIGCGDEGGVLVGDHNPEFNEIVAVCDIRPTNHEAHLRGRTGSVPRKGLNKHLRQGHGEEDPPVREHRGSCSPTKDKLGLEAVVIAPPLQHARRDRQEVHGRRAARPVREADGPDHQPVQGDDPVRQRQKGVLLSIGHQRHYSMLYAHALEVLESGILGDIKHIRALWHRNNSWPFTASDAEKAEVRGRASTSRSTATAGASRSSKEDADALSPEKLKELAFGNVDKYGFKDVKELVRWRLLRQDRRRPDGRTRQPPARRLVDLPRPRPSRSRCQGVGGKFFYGPGQQRPRERRRRLRHLRVPRPEPPEGRQGRARTRTTSSSSPTRRSTRTASKSYGECVMGSRGTMVVGEGSGCLPVQGEGTRQEGEQRRPRHQGDRQRGRRRQAGDGSDQHVGRRRRAAHLSKARRCTERGTAPSAATARRWSTSPTACGSGRS